MISPRIAVRDAPRLLRHAKRAAPAGNTSQVSCLTNRTNPRSPAVRAGTGRSAARPLRSAMASGKAWQTPCLESRVFRDLPTY